jgi:hypothetical protein
MILKTELKIVCGVSIINSFQNTCPPGYSINNKLGFGKNTD